MAYSFCQTSHNPRLLILLTDQSEESVSAVNKIIDQQIQLNYDGCKPKNRCFISVIGYGRDVKDLASGWLTYFDAHPLRIEAYRKRVPDGMGNSIDVEVRRPVWVEASKEIGRYETYVDSINLTIEVCKAWTADFIMSPIVVDCSAYCRVEQAITEIKELKDISTADGPVLFWGCYPNLQGMFSKMPDSWISDMKRCDMNLEQYANGCFTPHGILTTLGLLTDMAEEPGI